MCVRVRERGRGETETETERRRDGETEGGSVGVKLRETGCKRESERGERERERGSEAQKGRRTQLWRTAAIFTYFIELGRKWRRMLEVVVVYREEGGCDDVGGRKRGVGGRDRGAGSQM